MMVSVRKMIDPHARKEAAVSTVESERVLVIPTQVFCDLGRFQGFRDAGSDYFAALLDPTHIEYRARAEMETDPSFKQLIPYVIFRYTSDVGIQLFHYRRGAGQGESRLREKTSIGIGGHISFCDHQPDGKDTYRQGMQRELDEEVQVDTAFQDRVVGLINDEETEVGKVHLGVVHIFDVETPSVSAREEAIVDAEFRSLPQLEALRETMESWSRICFDALFAE